MSGPATSTLARLQRRLAKLDEERTRVVRAIEAIRPAAEAEGLTSSSHRGNTSSMLPARRLHHSEAVANDTLAIVANEAGYTIRSLAEKVGCSHTLLRFARRGDRSIKRSLAAKVEALLGVDQAGRARFAATAENWPKLTD